MIRWNLCYCMCAAAYVWLVIPFTYVIRLLIIQLCRVFFWSLALSVILNVQILRCSGSELLLCLLMLRPFVGFL